MATVGDFGAASLRRWSLGVLVLALIAKTGYSVSQ
jgi:hypothetical protein